MLVTNPAGLTVTYNAIVTWNVHDEYAYLRIVTDLGILILCQ